MPEVAAFRVPAGDRDLAADREQFHGLMAASTRTTPVARRVRGVGVPQLAHLMPYGLACFLTWVNVFRLLSGADYQPDCATLAEVLGAPQHVAWDDMVEIPGIVVAAMG